MTPQNDYTFHILKIKKKTLYTINLMFFFVTDSQAVFLVVCVPSMNKL
jgi:hypothetical protein